MRTFVAAFALFASAASAQEHRTMRWSLSIGPSIALRAEPGEPYVIGGWACGGTSCEPNSDVIAGGLHGKYHAALGVSREIRGSALILRGEVLYNRIESPAANRYIWFVSPTGPVFARHAMRDESYLASIGFEWDAFPSRAASPYLLTNAGYLLNRLRWNRDTASAQPDQQYDSNGLFVAPGVGFRVRVGRRELFTEWRRYAVLGAFGSRFAPFSIGVRF